jgi:hypothetical protein
LYSHDISNNFVLDRQIDDSQGLCFCFQKLSTWTTINTNGVDVVIPNIEPLDVVKEEACTIHNVP